MMRLLRILALVTALTLASFSPAQGDELPDSAYVSGMIGHAQGYNLSCESRSAADLAAFWGVELSETEFLEALPRSDNPDKGFVGNPNGTWGRIPPYSYGVYADPVAETLQDFGLDADALTGLSWDEVRREIAAGRPVIVWVIGGMWNGTPVAYEASDGSIVTVAPFEHTMLLTGYSLDAVQVIDAYSGEFQSYGLNTFLRSWSVLGNMAVFGSGNTETGEPQETETEEPLQPEMLPGTYIVQPGDFLKTLAERFNTTWQQLAELNAIGYPFTIYSGQVLQLPGSDGLVEEQAGIYAQASAAGQEGSFFLHLPIVGRNTETASSAPREITAIPDGIEVLTTQLSRVLHPRILTKLR